MSIKLKGSTDGSVTLQAPADTSPTGTDKTFTLPTQDGDAGQILKTDGSGALSFTDNLSSGRNILLNGDCRIAQRTTASQSHSAVGSLYGVDRFYAFANATGKVTVQQNQGSVTPPVGFQKYVGITSSGAYTPTAGNVFSFGQAVEAQNAAQLAWGTADAKAVTLSFWVRSSLTGTFGGAFLKQGINRSYLYTYTVNSANTWEYKTITIPGDTDTSISYNTSGNGLFGYFIWDYGTGDNGRGTAGTWASSYKEGVTGTNRLVSTSGATWYITGIQLEVGEAATSFEYRNFGDELTRCQRYYEHSNNHDASNWKTLDWSYADGVVVLANSSNFSDFWPNFKVVKRANPSVTIYSATGVAGNGAWEHPGVANNTNFTVNTPAAITTRQFHVRGGPGANRYIYCNWEASAEL